MKPEHSQRNICDLASPNVSDSIDASASRRKMGNFINTDAASFESLVAQEWLATNGLGGFACSTVPCCNTRKYHGLLVAAMTPPVRRMVLLSRLEETVHLDGWPCKLASNEYPGTVHPEGYRLLCAFSHDPVPRWAYRGQGWTLEKSLCLLQGQNTVCITYTQLGGTATIDLALEPLFALRGIHDLTYQWNSGSFAQSKGDRCFRVPATSRTPEVFFATDGAFESHPAWYFNTIYRRERERGYGGLEDLWTPGTVRVKLAPGHSVHFICSTDPIDFRAALVQAAQQRNQAPSGFVMSGSTADRAARTATAVETMAPSVAAAASGVAANSRLAALSRAARQFVGRTTCGASTGEFATVVTSRFPWSPPSCREALIAFAGLFLVTGHYAEGLSFLQLLAAKVRDGLITTALPEDGSAPLYGGADVSLWFVDAVHRYLRYSKDAHSVRKSLYEPVLDIVNVYRRGMAPGIRMDDEGLLITGGAGVAATWMDATLNDAPLTPRAGRAVEINALWYNALRSSAELAQRFGDEVHQAEMLALADKVRIAFNRRFWNEQAAMCWDVVTDGASDSAIRPNQLLALSLPFSVLDVSKRSDVIDAVRRHLLTPAGIRSLAPSDPGYQKQYRGAAASRDRARHNGAAYPWLLGALVSAYVRTHGSGAQSRREAEAFIDACLDHVGTDASGQLFELANGDAPHAPGGAIACAAAVGEILRCYVEDILGIQPDVTHNEAVGETLEFVVSPLKGAGKR